MEATERGHLKIWWLKVRLWGEEKKKKWWNQTNRGEHLSQEGEVHRVICETNYINQGGDREGWRVIEKQMQTRARVITSKQANCCPEELSWLYIPYLDQWEPPEPLQTERENADSLHDAGSNVSSVSPNNLQKWLLLVCHETLSM